MVYSVYKLVKRPISGDGFNPSIGGRTVDTWVREPWSYQTETFAKMIATKKGNRDGKVYKVREEN